MADISKIKLPSGTEYTLKDAAARADILTNTAAIAQNAEDIAAIEASIASAIHFVGYTTTALTDGATTNPIVIGGKDYDAQPGDVAIYHDSTKNIDIEFILDNQDPNTWNEFGTAGTLKAFAFVDTGTVKVTTADSATFSNSSVSASATYTPAGSVDVQLSQTATNATLTREAYTPAGSVSVSLTDTPTAATLTTADYTPEGSISVVLEDEAASATLATADYTPEGSVSTPTITVTPSTTTVQVLDEDGSVTAGSAASFTEGAFSAGTLPSKAADTWNAGALPTYTPGILPSLTIDPNDGETLVFNTGALAQYEQGTLPSFTEGAFDAGTLPSKAADTFNGGTPTTVKLPTFTNATVATGIASATSTQPVFSGTTAAALKVTGVTYNKQVVDSATFSGETATKALVTGVSYDKASVDSATFSGTPVADFRVTGVSYDKADVQSAGFTGTEATISSIGTATGDVILTKTEKTITVNPGI